MDAITTKLKKMLLSRNVVLQDKCIKFMISSLKDPKHFNLLSTMYLNADMIHFLCEPLLSINTSLIQSICLCIWMLSKNDKFYERNDVLFTCNSLMRTLVFLLSTKDPLVSDLIHLLAIIIKKGGANLHEVCNVPQVLSVIKMIFNNSQNLSDRCVVNAIVILTSFLSCPSIELSNKLYSLSLFISKAIYKYVERQCTIDPHVVDIASGLSSSLLRLYSTITSRVLIDINLKKHEEVAKLLKNVAWYMIKNICLPFVLRNINISIYYKSYRKGIKSLLSPFREKLSIRTRQNVANHYAASTIMRILYKLIEYNKIDVLVKELLHEMLFYLSHSYLEINCHWPGGIDIFRSLIARSIEDFPKTPRDICLALINNINNDVKHSIIIFIYFYFLTSSNVENESLYLEPMCVYLCAVKNEIPVPIIKAILFNISISFVSHNAVNTVSYLGLATKKLVSLMNIQMLDLVFTHHPALLYFLFATSIIPDKIQLELIKHWIQNLDDGSSIELKKFCLKNYKAKLCLLNVLANQTNIDNKKLQIGFNIVKQIITTEKDFNKHETILVIWEMLPIHLGAFCCNENSTATQSTNLMYLLNLTESCPLDHIKVSVNEHRDIVHTISSIIKIYKSTYTEQCSLLSSLLQHLLTLIQSPNNDVFNIIKKHQSFLNVLQNLCLSENNVVCFLSFKIIIQLCLLAKKFKTKCKENILFLITIKCEYILNAMTRLCHNCIISSITLFQIVMKYYEEDNNYKIVEFSEAPTAEFFKSIFMRLETIICQGLDWVSDYAWECMTIILSADLKIHLKLTPELQLEFATDPWLSFLLTSMKSFSKKSLTFLNFWFTRLVLIDEEKFTIRGAKILCPSVFDKTVFYVSSIIINQIHEDSESLTKAKTIINMVMKKNFLLCNEQKMKNFVNIN